MLVGIAISRKSVMSLQFNKKVIILRSGSIFIPFILVFVVLFLLFFPLRHQKSFAVASSLPDYETRRSQLLDDAAQLFADDPLRDYESELDAYPFTQINELECPKPIDNPNGWSVVMRTGGRPFLDFNTIEINSVSWPLERCTPGTSGIPQDTITQHYEDGKAVNRMWFTHAVSGTHPTVLVMTPDGFFNAAGAKPPELLGAATRVGFIGEPFGDADFMQHVDEVSISVVDDDTLAYSESAAHKTLRNLEQNPHISVLVFDIERREGYQFKGTTSLVKEGSLFDTISERQTKRNSPVPKVVVKINIAEIYQFKTGVPSSRVA